MREKEEEISQCFERRGGSERGRELIGNFFHICRNDELRQLSVNEIKMIGVREHSVAKAYREFRMWKWSTSTASDCFRHES